MLPRSLAARKLAKGLPPRPRQLPLLRRVRLLGLPGWMPWVRVF